MGVFASRQVLESGLLVQRPSRVSADSGEKHLSLDGFSWRIVRTPQIGSRGSMSQDRSCLDEFRGRSFGLQAKSERNWPRGIYV